MLKKISRSNFLQGNRFSKTNLTIFAVIFASIGGYLIFSSFAAGNNTSSEAENGSIAGNACTTNDNNASNSSAVKFGGCSGLPVNTVGPYFTANTLTGAAPSTCSNGCAVVGQTLGVSTGTWTNSPTSYTYQWDRCITTSAQPPTTASCSAISGATSSTYTVQSADAGHSLVPVVTAFSGSTASSPTNLSNTCNTGEMLGAGGGTPISAVPNGQPAGCSPISAVVSTTTGGEKFCTNAVTTCGYGDPMNQTTGVPAGTTLSTTGACAAYANGATISSGTVTINGCKITGSIHITGGNVTIQNSDITMHDNTQSTGGIVIGSGASSVAVKYDTIHGVDNTNGGSLAFAVYQQTNAPSITADHVFAYNVDRILMNYTNPSGIATLTNSECWNNSTIGGEHYECIYTAPPSNISAQDNVLLNQNAQTAVIFNDSVFSGSSGWEAGTGLTIDIENDLIGGGDFCIYGGGGSPTAWASNADTFLNNRFSRAIYSGCAQFGLSARDTAATTSSGNLWDDTGATVTP